MIRRFWLVGPGNAALLLTAILASGTSLTAQTLSGRVLEQGTDAIVDGAVVELLRMDSIRIRRTLTGRDGRWTLPLDRPGTYRIRVDRLGYRDAVLGPFVIAGDTVLDLRLAPQPFSLAPIEATGTGRCSVRPDVAESTSILWEQIRKVLAVTEVVREERLLEFDLLRFDRVLDQDLTVQRDESLLAWKGSDPFEGVAAEALIIFGFIQPADDRNIYWLMPEPDVILSDRFLDTHCFRVVRGQDGDRALLGLEFEPVDERRDAPPRDVRNPDFEELVRDDPADVAGVLWVDAETAALETLEYRYTGIRSDEFRELAGGHARFEQLTDGKWVVRQWLIRMPQYVVRASRSGRSRDLIAVGVIETGGELVQVHDRTGAPVTRRSGQRVSGLVVPNDIGVPFDSTTIVRFSGTSQYARVRSDGSFVFPDVASGRYLALVQHPRLDTLGIDVPVHRFTVSDRPIEVDLELPTRSQVLESVCPRVDDDEATGVLLVTVTGQDGQPLADQPIRLRSAWDYRLYQEQTTGGEGLVRFCDVPAAEPLEFRLVGHSDARVYFEMPARGFIRRDVRVGG